MQTCTCFHTYNPHNQRPTILDCGHTFCLSCIKSLVEAESVTCPKCRKISFNKTSEFVTNFARLDVLEKTCSEWLDELWTNNCDHCQTNLCNKCSQKHKEESQREVSEMLCDYREKIKITEHESKNKKYLEEVEHKYTSEKSEVKMFWNNVQKKVQTKRNSDMKALAKQTKHKSSVHLKWQCFLSSSVCKAETSPTQYTEKISKGYITHTEILTIKDEVKALLDSAEDIYSQQPSTVDLDISLSSDRIAESLASSGVLGETSGGEESTEPSGWSKDIFSLEQISVFRFLQRPTVKQTYWWLVTLIPIAVVLLLATFLYRSPACEYNYSTVTYVRSVGMKGMQHEKFNFPYDVAVSPINGNKFAMDAEGSIIEIFTKGFEFISMLRSGDTMGRTRLSEPGGIAINSKGEVFISQTYDHHILVLDENGKWLNTIIPEGLEQEKTRYLGSLAVDQEDNVYICDRQNNRILVMTADGTIVKRFGEHGTQPGQFVSMPRYIAVSQDGLVGVSDEDGHIYIFTTHGNHIRTINAGQSGSFHEASGITFDTDGKLIVADLDKLYVLTREGEVVANGTINSKSEVATYGVALTPDGYIVVCDDKNKQLQIFKIQIALLDDS